MEHELVFFVVVVVVVVVFVSVYQRIFSWLINLHEQTSDWLEESDEASAACPRGANPICHERIAFA